MREHRQQGRADSGEPLPIARYREAKRSKRMILGALDQPDGIEERAVEIEENGVGH